jgi:hypothetical protein
LNRARALLALALLIGGCSTAPRENRNIHVRFVDPKDAPPPTAEELHDQRIRSFVDQAHFVGTFGFSSDPHHFSTTDTVPIRWTGHKEPPGSQLRDQPLVEEFMRLDQLVMQHPPPMQEKRPPPLSDLSNGPLFSPGRQFDFMAELPGCVAPTRVMGSLTGAGTRRIANMMMPERKMAVVLAIDDADFVLGDLRDGSGFLPGLLGLVACA